METISHSHLIKLTILTSLFLTACGSGSATDIPTTDSIDSGGPITGVFVDSAVGGLHYQTDSLSGITNSLGEFQFYAGESITFSVGNVEFPSTAAKTTLTPLDLADGDSLSDTTVVNIVRLLQSLDNDGNPDNGIMIDDAIHSADTSTATVDFSSKTFNDQPAVQDMVAKARGGNNQLVDAETAVDHYVESLSEMVTVADALEQLILTGDDYFYLVYAGETYNGDTLQLSNKAFTLNRGGAISSGKLSVTNDIWHLWDRRNKSHSFAYVARADAGELTSCWGTTPEIAAACDTDTQSVYLFKDENSAVEFQSPTEPAIGGAEAEADALAQAEADALAQAEADALAQAEADALAQAEADALAQAEADALAQAEADALAQAEADALAQAEADALAQAEAEAAAQAAAEAEAAEDIDPSTVRCEASKADIRAAFLAATNDARSSDQECGIFQKPAVGILQWHDSLEQAASNHSTDMATYGFFSHTGSDGLNSAERATNAGFPSNAYVAENIAGGQTTVQQAHDAWMNSAGHCSNTMYTGFEFVGAACALREDDSLLPTPYWTITFGQLP